MFGNSVALSHDGNTALIGAREDNAGKGDAWVYTRSGSTWTLQANFTGAKAVDLANFGQSVALSADGNTASSAATGDHFVGAAWVFTRSGSTWTQQGEKFTGSEEIKGPFEYEVFFGWAVALSEDGNTALIGGPADNEDSWRRVGVCAIRLDLDTTGQKAHGRQRFRRSLWSFRRSVGGRPNRDGR